jgi:hypothetical protein
MKKIKIGFYHGRVELSERTTKLIESMAKERDISKQHIISQGVELYNCVFKEVLRKNLNLAAVSEDNTVIKRIHW